MVSKKFANVPMHEVMTDKTACHFYASSVGSWKVAEDPESLIRSMKREGMTFTVWLVPVDINATYQINFFSPQVDGAIPIAHYRSKVVIK